MTEQVASANSSNHDAQIADKHLSVKLSDKALHESNATWSPTSPFDLDFSYLDVDSPKAYTQGEQKLKTDIGSIELDFSYLNINSPKSRCYDEKHHSKSGLGPGKSGCEGAHSQAEFRIDIPNVVPQNEYECDRFYEEWLSPFSNGEDTSSSGTLTGSFCLSHTEFEPLLTSAFGDHFAFLTHSNTSPLGSNNISDLLELFRSNSIMGGCSLCNVDIIEERDVFIYMDKPFCSEECRDIFIEGESGYETMVDEETIPVANSYEHVGPIFLPINE